jgi:SUN family beta-glucosidase
MYYRHLGKKTSLQYYINNKGVPEHEACWWSNGTRPVGNWAPMNLGVSYDSDVSRAHISLFQNRPTTQERLDFTVEFLLEQPNSMKCRYSGGKWCSGDDYQNCKEDNCDVSMTGSPNISAI